MNQEQTRSLEEIRNLLSHLHGEVAALEANYAEVLLVLKSFAKTANVDDLTGLLRRNAFFETWGAMLEECRRLGESCGVLMIDIDHFKKINDTYGHPTGDEVIKRVSSLLKQFESPNCFAGRLGGEEFAVVVRGSDAEIASVAEFIRRGTERLEGEEVGAAGTPRRWKCTVSIGAAAGGRTPDDRDRLVQAADAALYRAKQGGRNRVQAA